MHMEKNAGGKAESRKKEEKMIDEVLRKVVDKVMEQMDPEGEESPEAGESSLESLIFETIMSMLEGEASSISDLLMDKEEEIEALIDDDGNFILN